MVVTPKTFIGWHRQDFRLFLAQEVPIWPAAASAGPPRLIRKKAGENPSWGEERIANELRLKLGLRVSPRRSGTVCPPRRPAEESFSVYDRPADGVGFIVTNLGASSRAVVRFYNKRGTAEQWIKEGKQTVAMTRLSCHRFRANEVRLWLSLIAYNLGNLWRRLALPAPIGKWSLTSLQQRW